MTKADVHFFVCFSLTYVKDKQLQRKYYSIVWRRCCWVRCCVRNRSLFWFCTCSCENREHEARLYRRRGSRTNLSFAIKITKLVLYVLNAATTSSPVFIETHITQGLQVLQIDIRVHPFISFFIRTLGGGNNAIDIARVTCAFVQVGLLYIDFINKLTIPILFSSLLGIISYLKNKPKP